MKQSPKPFEVILVDASGDDLTERIVKQFASVTYIRTEVGYGHMTKSRNLGLSNASGDIIAFLDDDAFVHVDWLKKLVEPYADPQVGGVGGRALNNQPNEEITGKDQIGRLLPNGKLTGYFAADSGQPIEVDHLIGCNMSWRQSVLAALGGLRDDYPGTEVREDTDIAIRVKQLGYKLIFQPNAIVTHVGAPQVRGRRFDTRYAYYGSRNHSQLLVRNFGLGSKIVIRAIGAEIAAFTLEFFNRIAAAAARLVARSTGLLVGLLAGVKCRFKDTGKFHTKN